MNGDTPAAKPDGALQYVAEGAFTTTQYNPETFPLTDELKAKGITTEQWVEICTSLRKGKGVTGMGGGFSKAISQANADYFDKLGLIGAYAEYHKGQKAMVVFPKEAVEMGRIKMP